MVFLSGSEYIDLFVIVCLYMYMYCRLIIKREFAPGFVYYKKGALDSQLQVIKITSYLPMFGGSPASATTKTGRHDIAEILLKVALNTKIPLQIQTWRVGIPLTSLIPPHLCACPKESLDFQRDVWRFFSYLVS